MPSYYVDTGCDNQIRVEADSQEEAISQFLREGYWHGSLEKQSERPYVDWSSVTFYVSPAQILCIESGCDEVVTDGGGVCCLHEECPECGETGCEDPHEED